MELSEIGMNNLAWNWFSGQNLGINICLTCLKNNTEIKDNIIPVFVQFGKFNLKDLLYNCIKTSLGKIEDYYFLLTDLLP